ncbi:alpha/beta fold hydrolase [Denitromonas ohlonensis]|uniref:Alpha/beta hydrolase n=2 Tax=Denitromonas TaxID=139331 RepID=A0A557RPZ5_9RHOO|nr:alpha/beta hydrolase [Denitromonas ohlonensis]TVO67236.1 alpha/beta hydrolase [Denitromonas ohlonensis]TVO79296.1 alpha/beta hydrolase [Denitromonas ohlonensis]TVT76347.1 MAG: alpha/beta hydrolase [Denitromonas halophila]
MPTLSLLDQTLDYIRLHAATPRAGAPTLVFLHEGLGAISMWRDFPQRLTDAVGGDALVYSRAGYGRSSPAELPRPVDYMHTEALRILPALLDALAIERPVLFGHSDGGSIALICAGATATPLSGIVVLAPHVMVEDITIAGIQEARARYETTPMRDRLGRHHDDPDAAFWGWNNVWLDPAFRDWNIEHLLPDIDCPVLAVQGEDDEYATLAQIDRIADGAPDVRLLALPDCRHSPHADQPDAVIAATAEFIASLTPASA